ncbi:MAG: high frequency lysogenization protein HflD [Pseudohongiellaceae bacterium]
MNNSSDKYSTWEKENIALAAVAQCAVLVDKLAVSGRVDEQQLALSLNPLFVLNPNSFSDIYPSVVDLSQGLRTIEEMFGNTRPQKDSLTLKYILGLLHLHNSFRKDNDMQVMVRQRIKGIPSLDIKRSQQSDDRIAVAENERSIKLLAALYQDTISTLSYRIQIQGKSDFLKDAWVAEQIRAILLSGIRSALLWHQLGGRRWRLLLYRSRVHETAKQIRRTLLSRH